jgi:two-component system, NarL family, nitrate/nitrite response regulator NarL
MNSSVDTSATSIPSHSSTDGAVRLAGRGWSRPPHLGARQAQERTASDPPLGPRAVTVLLACEVRLYREGLAQTLTQRAQQRLRVVAAAATGEEAVRLANAHRPDLALLDSALPDSVRVVREIAREVPQTRVLALAINESDENVIAIAEAGVAGYVCRDASHEDLIAAIERAARGEVLCPPNIVASLFRRMARMANERDDSMLPGLTAREQDVVELLGEGLSNKEIARRLAIRVATVKNHVHSIMQKLGVTRRFAVAALLMRERYRC